MSDQRVGSAIRAVRVRRGWRQEDLSRAAGVGRSTVSRVERGHLTNVSLDSVRAIGAALDIRVDLVARWRGGELDRLVNARHSALHESVARSFAGLPGWSVVPEASFSIFGERGVIDVLAWHSDRRAVLVVELKSELVDVQELIGSLDRKRRLARAIARERGWDPLTVSAWLVIAEGRTNRRHLAGHRTLLRTSFPADGHAVRSWLVMPVGVIAAMSFLPSVHDANLRRSLATPHRVRRPSTGAIAPLQHADRP